MAGSVFDVAVSLPSSTTIGAVQRLVRCSTLCKMRVCFCLLALSVLSLHGDDAKKDQSKDPSNQPATVQKVCVLEKKTYSPGALVKKGDKWIKCGANGKWARATKAEMGER